MALLSVLLCLTVSGWAAPCDKRCASWHVAVSLPQPLSVASIHQSQDICVFLDQDLLFASPHSVRREVHASSYTSHRIITSHTHPNHPPPLTPHIKAPPIPIPIRTSRTPETHLHLPTHHTTATPHAMQVPWSTLANH